MKSITKTLQDKYQNIVRNDKAKLSRFLKRRRIELGKTLEEVSEGICSTSYLSKIENCQVEVDDSYFTLLFEKLHLEYSTVVEQRLTPIYSELIKAYLVGNLDFIRSKVNLLIETGTYCESEIEMILVLYNLIEGNFAEASASISKIELIKNTLSEEELRFVGFLNVLYYYKTYNYDMVRKEIEVLLKSTPNDDIVNLAIVDLALNYYFIVGKTGSFFELYDIFKNNQYIRLLKTSAIEHELQRLVILSSDLSKNEIDDIEERFMIVKDSLNSDEIEIFKFYYAMHLVNHKMYEKAYLLLKDSNISNRNLSLMALCIDKLQSIQLSMEFLKILEVEDWASKTPHYDYIEYVRLKLEQYSYNQLYNYLKNQVLPNQNTFSYAYLKDIEMNEYFKLAFELGKYKEIAKNILNK